MPIGWQEIASSCPCRKAHKNPKSRNRSRELRRGQPINKHKSVRSFTAIQQRPIHIPKQIFCSLIYIPKQALVPTRTIPKMRIVSSNSASNIVSTGKKTAVCLALVGLALASASSPVLQNNEEQNINENLLFGLPDENVSERGRTGMAKVLQYIRTRISLPTCNAYKHPTIYLQAPSNKSKSSEYTENLLSISKISDFEETINDIENEFEYIHDVEHDGDDDEYYNDDDEEEDEYKDLIGFDEVNNVLVKRNRALRMKTKSFHTSPGDLIGCLEIALGIGPSRKAKPGRRLFADDTSDMGEFINGYPEESEFDNGDEYYEGYSYYSGQHDKRGLQSCDIASRSMQFDVEECFLRFESEFNICEDPIVAPTDFPTMFPTKSPTKTPKQRVNPTEAPTYFPTLITTTEFPTFFPTSFPTKKPTANPTNSPTSSPTANPTRAPFEIKFFGTNPPTSSVRNFPPSEVASEAPSEAPSEECVESKGKGKSKGGKSKGKGGKSKGGKSKGCKSKGKGGKSKGGKSKNGSKSGSKGTKSKNGSKGTKSKNGSKSGDTNASTTTGDRDSPLDGFKDTKSSSSSHRKRTKAKHRKAKLATRRFLEDTGFCVDLLIDVSIVFVSKIVWFLKIQLRMLTTPHHILHFDHNVGTNR